MSDVLFHSKGKVAALAAVERARAATLVDDLALGLLAPHRPAVARRLFGLLHPDHFLRSMPVDSPGWADGFRAAFSGHVDAGLIQHSGATVETFPLALNSAMLAGNDCVRLLAWVHAECESSGYVESPHRDWLAEIISTGLETGLLRPSAGWDGVAELLRAPDRGPVVLSVSGEGGFGAGDTGAPWEGPRPDRDAATPRAVPWPAAEWAPAIADLRADHTVVPLDPQSIGRPYGHGLTVLDLIAADSWQRLESVKIPVPTA